MIEKEMNNKILVAEDEEYNFTLLKLIFEREGQQILWAKNGAEAVKIFEEYSDIDLVLMDIKMPVMNGLDASRIIKGIRKQVPIIAVTAYAMSEDR
ncbi:MAG: response regulator, partial [Bacteroidales bacterium]